MYIRKYQIGGIAYTPFIPTSATPQTKESSTGGTTKTTTKDSKKAALEDDIINILKENGIPSDVNAFLSMASSFLNKSSSLSSTSLFGGSNDDYSMNDLIRLQAKANEIKFNKEKYNDAVANLNDENAWSDYAMDTVGNFYAINSDGKLTKKSASEVSKFAKGESDEEFQLLTYSQLTGLRENGLAFNTDILRDLENAYGKQSESTEIIKQIKDFSTNKLEGVTSKSAAANKGMEIFSSLMEDGPDGYYKFTSEDQVKNENAAASLIWSQIGSVTKNGIKRDIALRGGDPNSRIEQLNEIKRRIYSYAEMSYSVNFDSTTTKAAKGSGSGSGGSEQLTEDNYLQMIGLGRLTPGGIVTITPHAAKIADTGTMVAQSYTAGAPVDNNFEQLGVMNLSQFKQKATALKAANTKDFTFGNKVLSPEEIAAVVYDGSSEFAIVDLPYTTDNAGRITPAFNKLDAFNKIQRELSKNPNMNNMKFAQICKENNIDPSEIDRTSNSIKFKKTMAFITFSAYAGDKTLDLSDDNKRYLEQVDPDKAKLIIDVYNNSVQYGDMNINKNSKKIFGNFDDSNKRHLYKGNVFAPIPDAFRALLLSGKGEYVGKDQMTDFASRVQARNYEVERAQQVREQYPHINPSTLGQFN